MLSRIIDKPFLVFGEILWDIFPDGRRLGGAPLNFSYYFKRAGGNPRIISAVGKDELGIEAVERIKMLGLDTSFISKVDYPTGIVKITLSKREPSFEIARNTAWERISYQSNSSPDAMGIYLGTVSRVSENNRVVLDSLLDQFQDKIVFLDLNLRQTLYSRKDIRLLLSKSNYLKINEDESFTLKRLGIVKSRNPEDNIDFLIKEYNLQGCCITLGEKGAISGNKNSIIRVDGIPAAKKGDNTGAGDAFAATWFANLMMGNSLNISLEKANSVGSKVASERGAIVKI